MRVVFMGTPDFAVPTLEALAASDHELICVVAQPDRPKGRGKKLQSPDTVVRARELGIEVRQPRAIKRGPFPEWLESVGADVAVVVAYGRILTESLLRAPRLGCINVHASLLPRYRGAAPIHWAVMNGETETGVATMQMDVGLDTGDVLLEARTPIGPEETAGDLWDRLSGMGAELLIRTLDQLESIEPRPQDHSQATHAPLMTKEVGRIDWSWSAQKVHDRVRGSNPWPGAHTRLREEPFKIRSTRIVDGSGTPGEIIVASKRLVVACGTGAVELLQAQLPGKRAQSGSDLINGGRIRPGECLG
jgi:methionyl-tRNA formyltransferase